MSSGRMAGLAHQMQVEALAENHPAHAQHVQHYIEYANAVGDSVREDLMRYIQSEVSKMIDEKIQKHQETAKVNVELDEKSVQTVKSKISDLIRSLFH